MTMTIPKSYLHNWEVDRPSTSFRQRLKRLRRIASKYPNTIVRCSRSGYPHMVVQGASRYYSVCESRHRRSKQRYWRLYSDYGVQHDAVPETFSQIGMVFKRINELESTDAKVPVFDRSVDGRLQRGQERESAKTSCSQSGWTSYWQRIRETLRVARYGICDAHQRSHDAQSSSGDVARSHEQS